MQTWRVKFPLPYNFIIFGSDTITFAVQIMKYTATGYANYEKNIVDNM